MEVRWSARALADMLRISAFNEQRSIAWAQKVEKRITERVQALLRLPEQGRRLEGSAIRLLSLPDIQYVISYVPTPNTIRILRVRSTREIIEGQ